MSTPSETHVPSPVSIPAIPAPATTPTPAPVAPVTPVQAAPVAPTAPAVPTPTPEVAPPTGEGMPMDTGNPALDTAIDVFISVTKATEADMMRAVGKALEYGREDLIDLAFIKEKFGEHSEQAIKLAKAAISAKADNLQRQTTEVHALAGSKANWDAAVSVYQTNAPDYVKAAVVALMDSGKVKEGTQMLLDYAKSQGLMPGTVPLDNPTTVPGAAGALDAQGFRAELDKLYKAAGGRSLESGPIGEQYQALLARRNAGRALGR